MSRNKREGYYIGRAGKRCIRGPHKWLVCSAIARFFYEIRDGRLRHR